MPCEKYELFYFPLNAMMYCSPLGQDWFRLNKSSSCRSPDSGYPPQYGGWMVFSEDTIIFRIQYTKYNGIISPVYTVGPSGCPKKHGNSVTNSISSFQIILWFSIVIPTEKAVICESFVCYVNILFVYVLTYGHLVKQENCSIQTE